MKMTTSPNEILMQRLASLQQKVAAIISRIQIIEAAFRFTTQQCSSDANPLEKYLAEYSEIHSLPSQHSKFEPQSFKQHSRRHSQPQGTPQPIITKIEHSERAIDSKSFAIIKKSILLNSEEMQHMRERMIEMQKEFIERIMGIQEGVAILTRLSQIMESKISKNEGKEGEETRKKQGKKVEMNSSYEINRVIKKYNKVTVNHGNHLQSNPSFFH